MQWQTTWDTWNLVSVYSVCIIYNSRDVKDSHVYSIRLTTLDGRVIAELIMCVLFLHFSQIEQFSITQFYHQEKIPLIIIPHSSLLLRHLRLDTPPCSKSKHISACRRLSTDFSSSCSFSSEADSALKRFIEKTSKMTSDERAVFLEKDEVRRH